MDKITKIENDCFMWEIMCPDGLVRHLPYHNYGDALSHASHASDPIWFKKRKCRLAPKPGLLELSLPPCSGGCHEVKRVTFN